MIFPCLRKVLRKIDLNSEVCLVAQGCQLPEAAHSVLYLLKFDNLEYYVQ
jgi:hypothetical protein